MIREVDVFGVYLPPLLLYAGVAALAWHPVRLLLERLGFYRFVWHPALFNASAYLVVLAGTTLLFMQGPL